MSMVPERQTETLPRPRLAEITTLDPGRLVVQVSDDQGPHLVEVDGPRITVGAHSSNGIEIEDSTVSRIHCELYVRSDGAALRDLGSKNGTWLDGARIQETWLPLGGAFSIGRSTVTLESVNPIEVPISTLGHFGRLQGRGSEMGKLFALLDRVAATALDVLVIGETGTGKELIAQGLHERSDRCDGPFVVVDCTTLNEGIAESILFGHCKGTFTDASTDHAGLLEQAHGGTLFLDEIGELPMKLQPKLLRALQQRETRRIGEHAYRRFDARVIAATNRDLPAMVCAGSFRDDLYFRFGTMAVHVPPLRARGDGDISGLADLFVEECAQERAEPLRLDKSAYDVLTRYSWPGNVRQLQGVIRRVGLMIEREVITASDLPQLDPRVQRASPWETEPRRELWELLESALDLPWSRARPILGRIYASHAMMNAGGNQTKAAKRAGMSRSAFRDLVSRSKG